MSRWRWSFVILLSLICGVWACAAIFGQSVRHTHRHLITAIRDGENLPSSAESDRAISDYRSALKLLPCNASLHREVNILIAQRTDAILAAGDVSKASDALDEMHEALSDTLACAPTDGKAWIDFAVISIHREGFNARALGAYKTSARVAPRESWLAEKRLYFALTFLSLIDPEARLVAQSDIAVLERAHPNRIQAVMNVAEVTSVDALRALFNG
jgi:hypothetical protein